VELNYGLDMEGGIEKTRNQHTILARKPLGKQTLAISVRGSEDNTRERQAVRKG
jgi:hypothetical protein